MSTNDLNQVATCFSDHRKTHFFMIDNEFDEAGFDSYTYHFYCHIVKRAQNSVQGFTEFRKTTATLLQMSVKKLEECTLLLEYCGIIRVYHQTDPNNPQLHTKNRIVILDKSLWNLAHSYRNSGQFIKKFGRQKSQNLIDEMRNTVPCEARGVPTVRREGPYCEKGGSLPREGLNNTPFNKTPLNNVCGKKSDQAIKESKSTHTEEKEDLKKEKELVATAQALSIALCTKFQKQFVPNANCEDIVYDIGKTTGMSLKEIRTMINNMLEEYFDDVFSTRRFSFNMIAQDLIKYSLKNNFKTC